MSTTMLYRPADEPNPACWDMNLEHRVFADEEVPGALEGGWVRHPNDLEADAQPEGETPRRGRKPKADAQPEG